MRRLARFQHIDPVVRHKRPVVMLSGTIDSGKRLLMQQTLHSMLARHPLQCLHHDLIVIHRDIDFRVDRRQFMLCRSHLVMLGLCGNTNFPEFNIDIAHKRRDPLADRAEIMIVQFLSFRRHCAEQRSSGIDQVFSLQKFLCIHKEIFLLGSDRRRYFSGCCIPKQPEQTQGFLIDRLHGTKKRRLLVERFTGIRTKCSRNTKYRPRCILSYKCRRSAIPCRISSRLKCSAQSARRKGRRIRLAFDQFFSRETHQHLAARQRCGNKRIMLLGRHSGQRQKPVRIVSCPFLDRPLFHLMRDHISGLEIELFPLFNGLFQILVNLFRQTFLHHRVIEYIFTENIRNIDQFCTHSPSSLLHSIHSRSKTVFYEKRVFHLTWNTLVLLFACQYSATF